MPGSDQIGYLANGDWARYDNVDFGTTSPKDFLARVSSGAAGGVSGTVEVRLDNVGNAPVASFAVADTGGWSSFREIPGNLTSQVTGRHTVFLRFSSGQPADFVNVDWFVFRR